MTPSRTGTPVILASSTNAGVDVDESLRYVLRIGHVGPAGGQASLGSRDIHPALDPGGSPGRPGC